MGKGTPAHERRAKDAAERAATAGALTPQQKLERLDRALGVGVGAKRERAKLAAKIAGPVRAASTTAAPATPGGPAPAAEAPVILASDGPATMSLSAGTVNIIVGNHKVPVISMSQLRRMGDQHGFDGNEFARQYRAHLAASGQP
jgi:hypothetical protein